LLAKQLPRHQTMREHYVHGRAQVQREVGGDVNEAMTQTPNHLRHASVFGPENVNRIFRMLEGGQRLALLKDFYTNRRDIIEQIQRTLVVAEQHVLVSLHPLLARESPILRRVDAQPRPGKRFDAEARARPNGRADVVRELRIDQHHAGRA